MKILCLYVLSGNGHLVPARTMKIELEKLGHEVRLEQVFDVLKMQLVGKLNRIIWREMLRHSKTEEMIVGGADHSNAISFLTNFCLRHRMKTLKAYLDDFPCDAIFATHPYGSTILSEMIKAMGGKTDENGRYTAEGLRERLGSDQTREQVVGSTQRIDAMAAASLLLAVVVVEKRRRNS